MTGIIELARVGLVDQITELVDQIDTATAGEAKDAFDRMGVVREWAKLQANAEELTERLAWLEAVILRRIGQLDVKQLPGAQRNAARHFATLDDEAMAKLFTDYPARRAISVYNLWAREQGIMKSRTRGRRFGTGERTIKVDDDADIDDRVRNAMDYRITSVRQAAAVLIDEYAAGGMLPTTVSHIVDDFINDEMDNMQDGGGQSAFEKDAFRRGLTDAVREAFTTAPVETTVRSGSIPAYITVFNEETDEWLRVPSEFARVADARQMLALRRGQIASAQRSLDALDRVLTERFRINEGDGSDYLRDDTTALTRRMMRDRKESVPA